MKTTLRFQLVICLIVTLFSSITVDGSVLQKTDPVIPIVLTPYPTVPEGGPRTPSTTRVEASLDMEFGIVEVHLQNAGISVTVDIENTTTGSTYQYIVSGDGLESLPISLAAGYWTITFTLLNGTVYSGAIIL